MRLPSVRYFDWPKLSLHTTVVRYFSSAPVNGDTAKSSVEKNEVDFFSKVGKDWWDKNGSMKSLHAMNDIRVPFIRNGLINAGLLDERKTLVDPNYLEGLSIADVGCGGGILSIALARLGGNITGIEPSKESVEVATNAACVHNVKDKAKFISTSIEDYSKEHKDEHDAVVCSEVIEHVTDKESFLDACLNTLKPGGCIFVTTLNRTPIGGFLTITVAEYLLRVISVGTHSYDKFITPEELEQMLAKKNCVTQMVCGSIYLPLVNRFIWTKSNSVHYSLVAVKRKSQSSD